MSQSPQLPVIFEFNSSLTFTDFIQGKNQEIIAQLKKTVAGFGENQLLLWGSSGYGKSHLLLASCYEADQLGVRTYYIDLSQHKVNQVELLQGIESYQLAAIDNVDAIAGYDQWEIALFNAYNRLRENGRIMILSASCHPTAVSYTLPDIKTRINSGLSLKIQEMADDDKIAALTLKAQRLGMNLTPEVARFMLFHHDRSLTSLWAMLDKLDKESLATKRKLTIPFLKQILG